MYNDRAIVQISVLFLQTKFITDSVHLKEVFVFS